MADVTAPEILEGAVHLESHTFPGDTDRELALKSERSLGLTAYNDVRSDKTETNWLLLTYEVFRFR